MQTVLDHDLIEDNTRRPHQGLGMNGRARLGAFRTAQKEQTSHPEPTQKAA
jgi:hypothetical protein